jgi:hypothetical protein
VHLSYVVVQLSYVVVHLSSTVVHLSYALVHLSSVVEKNIEHEIVVVMSMITMMMNIMAVP